MKYRDLRWVMMGGGWGTVGVDGMLSRRFVSSDKVLCSRRNPPAKGSSSLHLRNNGDVGPTL